ncbi:MAG TPA: hypothetical protein VKY85_01720 [Candidatus Angelobacter sp.]|nr:hypothetical protein [Candidatus Angelobacter sp.]
MAESNLNSGERDQVYQALFLLNRSFHLIVQRLEELDKTGIFDSQHLKQLRGLTQELQADVNNHLLEKLHFVEREDCYHFSKVRIARDHRLNPERPALRKSSK